jgi:hypothetical protein
METTIVYFQKNPGRFFGEYLLGIKDIQGKERTGRMKIKGNSLEVPVLGMREESFLVLLPKEFGNEPAWISSKYLN